MFAPANANSLLDAARDLAGRHLSCAGITEAEDQVQTAAASIDAQRTRVLPNLEVGNRIAFPPTCLLKNTQCFAAACGQK